jgi:putative flippase GtrA
MTDTAPTPRLVKFGIVGVLATLSHYAVIFSGLFFWDAPVIWSFLGAVTGAVAGYFLNYTPTPELT